MLTPATLEEFAKVHEHTIAAVSALGTVLASFSTVVAIIVSLHLARRGETTRLRAVLGIGIATYPTAPAEQHVTLKIHNMSRRVESLSNMFFEWRFPFLRKHQPETTINFVNAVCVINRQTVIDSDTDFTMDITNLEDFRRFFIREIPLITRKMKWLPKTRLRLLSAAIYTSEDKDFRVKFTKAMKAEIRAMIKGV